MNYLELLLRPETLPGLAQFYGYVIRSLLGLPLV